MIRNEQSHLHVCAGYPRVGSEELGVGVGSEEWGWGVRSGGGE